MDRRRKKCLVNLLTEKAPPDTAQFKRLYPFFIFFVRADLPAYLALERIIGQHKFIPCFFI